jgi:hypothetical protein
MKQDIEVRRPVQCIPLDATNSHSILIRPKFSQFAQTRTKDRGSDVFAEGEEIR